MTNSVKMDRRSFLKKSALAGGAVSAGTLAAPAVLAQSPIVIKMQTSWGASNIWDEFAKDYAVRVDEMSGGRLKIDVLPAGCCCCCFPGSGRSQRRPDRRGAHRSGLLVRQEQSGIAFRNRTCVWRICHHDDGLVLSGRRRRTVPRTHPGHNGARRDRVHGLSDVRPTLRLVQRRSELAADLNGFKYRTVGLAADLLQSMGMSVAQLPGGEIVPAMERGVIDAFEFNNPSSDKDFGAHDVAKHYYLSSYHQASESFEFLFSRAFLEDLDPDLQAILKYSVEAASTANTAKAMDRYSADLEWLQKKPA